MEEMAASRSRSRAAARRAVSGDGFSATAVFSAFGGIILLRISDSVRVWVIEEDPGLVNRTIDGSSTARRLERAMSMTDSFLANAVLSKRPGPASRKFPGAARRAGKPIANSTRPLRRGWRHRLW